MAMMKIKKGDLVRVTTGKDKNKEGKVVSINHKKHRLIVEGVNMVTKHMKPSAANANGGIIQKEAEIDVSNVVYLHKGQPAKVGFKFEGDKKVRYVKKTGDVID